jgi:methyl-accepting chemotaxis protein
MRLTVRNKLLAGFVTVLVLTGVVGYLGVTGLNTMSASSVGMYNDRLVPISDLGTIKSMFIDMKLKSRAALFEAQTPAEVDAVASYVADADKTGLALLDKYSKTSLTSEEQQTYTQLMTDVKNYIAARDDFIKTAKAGNKTDAATKLETASTLAETTTVDLDKLIEINDHTAQQMNIEGQATSQSSTTLMLGVIGFAVVLGLGIAVWLSTSVANGVKKMSRAAEAVAEGDLEQTIDVKSRDEVGQCAEAFRRMIDYLKQMAGVANSIAQGDLSQNVQPKSERDALGASFGTMVVNLRALVGQVAEQSTQVSEASRQLSEASSQAGAATQQITASIQQVARGAQEQSSSIGETSQSVEQLARAIDQIAKGAQEQARGIELTSKSVNQSLEIIEHVTASAQTVAEASNQASKVAREGAVTVGEAVQAMGGVKEGAMAVSVSIDRLRNRSEEIGNIVETIDDIAEQTNLLALNAAIEAARAGEHGKGFAVVADEVRKLAERSSKATKEITLLIQTVQSDTDQAVQAMSSGAQQVEVSTALSAKAGQALQEILAAVDSAVARVKDIETAAKELGISSAEVVKAIDSVSAIVEENTAATEQMAANSTGVTRSIESIAAIIEENGAATQEVNAATEEMAAQVEEMTASAQSLAEMAQQLQSAVGQFKSGREDQGEMIARRRKDDWSAAQGPPRLSELRTG